MNRHLVILVTLFLGFGGLPSQGQEAPVDEAALQTELDEYREGLFALFNEGNYEQMLNEYCHPDVIALWQDGQKSQGYAAVLAEFDRLSAIIDRIQVNPTVEERLVLNDGNLVISCGKMRDSYDLKRGETVELESLWSATLIKQDGKWLMISFSGNANAFDNNVITLYFGEASRRFAAIVGIAGIIVGALVTFIVLRKRGRAVSG